MRAETSTHRTRTAGRAVRLLAIAALLVAAAGCRQGMFNQQKYKPLAADPMFADGTSARPLPENTIARGHLDADQAFYKGLDQNMQPVAKVPFPVTREVLERGRERYNIFCSPCHGETGAGDGMIVRRGYKQPPSYLEPRLLAKPVGYFYIVATQGFGQMPAYASQVPPKDRWAIASYIRALQFAQHAPLAELPSEDQQQLSAETANPDPGETAKGEQP